MSLIIRSKHFKKYIEDMYVGCMAQTKGIEESVARVKFQDTFMDDFNILNWILPSTYPNTIRDGDSYSFITDNMIHTDINKAHLSIDVGRMTFKINKDYTENISFENKEFMHGQVYEHDGHIRCYGGFGTGFAQKLCDIGLSGALMEVYNFARVSDHNTKVKGVAWEG